jgi:hypothetical protein
LENDVLLCLPITCSDPKPPPLRMIPGCIHDSSVAEECGLNSFTAEI